MIIRVPQDENVCSCLLCTGTSEVLMGCIPKKIGAAERKASPMWESRFVIHQLLVTGCWHGLCVSQRDHRAKWFLGKDSEFAGRTNEGRLAGS